jgi:hypothetical protein
LSKVAVFAACIETSHMPSKRVSIRAKNALLDQRLDELIAEDKICQSISDSLAAFKADRGIYPCFYGEKTADYLSSF